MTSRSQKVPDYVGDHLRRYKDLKVKPVIECRDGFTYSVQASFMHYCTPKKDGLDTYTSVEVWGKNRFGVYTTPEPEGFVRIETINRRIYSHGGTKENPCASRKSTSNSLQTRSDQS